MMLGHFSRRITDCNHHFIFVDRYRRRRLERNRCLNFIGAIRVQHAIGGIHQRHLQSRSCGSGGGRGRGLSATDPGRNTDQNQEDTKSRCWNHCQSKFRCRHAFPLRAAHHARRTTCSGTATATALKNRGIRGWQTARGMPAMAKQAVSRKILLTGRLRILQQDARDPMKMLRYCIAWCAAATPTTRGESLMERPEYV